MLRYKGAAHFRQRIVLATLSGRAVRIDDIRSEEEQVGLRDYEACFLRLLEKVVNGCEIVINETGTAMRYRPGIIVGGGGHVHECGTSRAISYFIQPLLALAPFGKQPLSVTLRGVTNATGDVGVDVLRTVTLPMLRHFGLSEGLSLQVNKRGAPPLGGNARMAHSMKGLSFSSMKTRFSAFPNQSCPPGSRYSRCFVTLLIVTGSTVRDRMPSPQ